MIIPKSIRKRFPVRTWYLHYKLRSSSLDDQFPNVEWLSHHIPKTAGSSFYYSLDHAYRGKHIQGVYPFNNLPKRLTTGQSIWVRKSTKVIHGHFRPHKNQLLQFPNAKRIIWIRDPVERNISYLQHLLRTEHNNIWQANYIRANYNPEGRDFEELLSRMIDDPELYQSTRIYESFFQSEFQKSDFAFIGWVNQYTKDLARLEKIMGTRLPEFRIGVKPDKSSHRVDNVLFKKKLQSEYDLLADLK
jgi:Sulfotransferase family